MLRSRRLASAWVASRHRVLTRGCPSRTAALYFINRGLVQLLQRDAPVATLTNSDNFGADDFYQAEMESAPLESTKSALAVTVRQLHSTPRTGGQPLP